jgi:hypothetical protein
MPANTRIRLASNTVGDSQSFSVARGIDSLTPTSNGPLVDQIQKGQQRNAQKEATWDPWLD